MSQSEFLQLLASQFDAAGISYMVSGSVASGYHGQPRATYAIDFVVESSLEQLDRLLTGLSDRCYVSASAARDAIAQRTQFNVIDLESGIKADLIIRKERPFSVEEFQRRSPAVISGVPVDIVTPEDCILSKLEWAQLGESQRQFHDALQVAQVLGRAGLDIAYLRRWSAELKVDDLLERLLQEIA